MTARCGLGLGPAGGVSLARNARLSKANPAPCQTRRAVERWLCDDARQREDRAKDTAMNGLRCGALALIALMLMAPAPAQDEPFRRVADEFIAAAAAGDKAKAARLISPAAAANAGPEGVDRF